MRRFANYRYVNLTVEVAVVSVEVTVVSAFYQA